MSKQAEFKTNVMRILEQAKVPFRQRAGTLPPAA